MSRRVTLICVLTLVALAAAGAFAAIERAVWIDLDRIESDVAPPYPWPEPTVTAVERRLEGRKVTFTFNATPLAEVVDFLNDFVGVPCSIDPAIDGQRETIHLRARDVTARRALDLIASATSERCVPVFDASGVRFAPARGRAETLVSVRALRELAEIETEMRRRLATDDVAFVGSSLQDAFDEVGVGLDVGEGIDPARPVAVRGAFTPAGLLDAVAAEVGFHWCLRDGVVRVQSGVAPVESSISCELVGATVPDLVAALAKSKVDAVATESAWSSRGTFSITLQATPLPAALAAIASASRLEIVRLERKEGDVVVIGGAVPCVQEVARASEPRFRGVSSQLRTRKRALARLVAERLRRRTAGEADPARLVASERAVHDAIVSAGTFLDEVHLVAGARASLPLVLKLRSQLETARAADRVAADADDGTPANHGVHIRATRSVRLLRARLGEFERGHPIEDDVALLERLEKGEELPERPR